VGVRQHAEKEVEFVTIMWFTSLELSISRPVFRHWDVPLHHPTPTGHPTMRYALLIHYPQPPAISLSDETVKQGKAAFHTYAKALDDAGVLRSAEVLQTVANATSVSMKQGKLQIQDGPFADTKEAFAGIFTLDVPDLDAALAWAEKCPAAHWGTVEIRPSAVQFVDGAWVNAN
jgi:hypothetical protein